MIKSIRIKNLRALRDTEEVDIKPLTILLGKNSSGKSTFLRTFPLMTQSSNKRLRNAIAWFDDNLVDFGDFSTSLNREAAKKDEAIEISLRLGKLEEYLKNPLSNYTYRQLVNSRIFNDSVVTVSFRSMPDGKGTYISEVAFGIRDEKVTISFSYKGKTGSISVNGTTVETPQMKWSEKHIFEFLPAIRIEVFEEDTTRYSYSRRYNFMENLRKWTVSPLLKYCSARFTHYEKLYSFINEWNIDKNECLERFKKFKPVKSLQDQIKKWSVNSAGFKKIYNNILAYKILANWDYLSVALGDYFRSCDYAAPLRAEARRYYRNQGLQTDVIDAYGRNTSEFIDSLTETQRQSYNEYLESVLKVNIVVRNNMGHQSMNVISGDAETNITDVGFGYSQILPIISKLWLMQTRNRFTARNYYKSLYAVATIEQPELHLHPAMQAKLADAFIHAAINEEAKTTIIVETHSPTIINRIGRRIREGYIKTEDVNVVVFDKADATVNTAVHQMSYNEEGQIEDWPYGFFEPKNDPF